MQDFKVLSKLHQVQLIEQQDALGKCKIIPVYLSDTTCYVLRCVFFSDFFQIVRNEL